MPAFAKHLYEGPITRIAVAIPSLVLPWLQQGLEIIERQQTTPFTQEL